MKLIRNGCIVSEERNNPPSSRRWHFVKERTAQLYLEAREQYQALVENKTVEPDEAMQAYQDCCDLEHLAVKRVSWWFR